MGEHTVNILGNTELLYWIIEKAIDLFLYQKKKVDLNL